MKDFKMLSVALAIIGQGAMADPVTDLRCTEAAWQQASTTLHNSRDAVWDRMNLWLDRPAQSNCTAMPDPGATFTFQCGVGDEQFETVLRFEPVDQARLADLRGLLSTASIINALTSPEMTEAFAQLEQELTDLAEDLTNDLAEAGVKLTITAPEPAPENEATPRMSVSDILAGINPVQNSLGLTATVTWPQAIAANDLTQLDDLLRMNDLLQALERGDPTRGNTVAQATGARAQVLELTAQQAAVWSDAHMPLAARRFQLFDQPRGVVQEHEDSISVIDIASWSQTPSLGHPTVEGVEELVFFYAPQPEFAQIQSEEADCKVLKTFPCPPLNGGTSDKPDTLGDIPEGCADHEGCEFTTLRWVNDHVAVRTYLRARQAEADDIERFAARLTTLRTKSLLEGFAPDADFDPAVCPAE